MGDHICINGARKTIAARDCVACLRVKADKLTAERDEASKLAAKLNSELERLTAERDRLKATIAAIAQLIRQRESH